MIGYLRLIPFHTVRASAARSGREGTSFRGECMSKSSEVVARPKRLRWDTVKWVVLTLFAFAVGAAGTGATYQGIAVWRDARRFPQHGKSVRAGALRLNLDCSGERSASGRPIVILDSGIGIPALGWIKVQPEAAKFARVCSYDRAAYGWSDTGPEPRSSSQIATELKILLSAAGEKGPYILVGHSFGGFNVRVFTALYPTDVSGVVFVDGAPEDEEKRIDEILPTAVVEQENRNNERSERLNDILMPLRIRLGIQRLQVTTGWRSPLFRRPSNGIDQQSDKRCPAFCGDADLACIAKPKQTLPAQKQAISTILIAVGQLRAPFISINSDALRGMRNLLEQYCFWLRGPDTYRLGNFCGYRFAAN